MQDSPKTPPAPAGIEKTAAGLIGLAPALIFVGRAPLAVAAILALVLIVASPSRGACLKSARSVVFSGLGLSCAVLFVLWLPSVVDSPHPDRSFLTVVRSALFVVAALPLWAFLRLQEGHTEIALKVLVISGLILSLVACVAITWWPQLYNITHLRNPEPLDAALAYKQTGSTAVLVIPLTIFAAFRYAGKWRGVAILATVALASVIWLTGSRAGMIGLIATGIVVAGILIFRHRRIALGAATAVLGAAILIGAVVWNAGERAGTPPDDAVVYLPNWTVDWHRQTIWYTAWEKSADHRLFGVGVNAINFLPGAQETIGNSNNKVLAHHPHNWLIEVAAETGVISATWMMGILLIISCRLWRLNGPRKDAALAASAIWTGYWISGLFNFSYWSSWWMVSFYICFAIALAASREDSKARNAA